MRHIIPISGKDSLATALLLHKNNPKQDYELMFNPTGLELPELFEWIDRVEVYFGKPIARVGRDLKELIEEYGYFLPSGQARYCTRECKIEPMEEFIGQDECMVYYGIRADEKRIGYQNNRYPNIIPNNPLIDAGIGINGVYEIINEAGLKPPTFFWKSVYDEVCRKIGGEQILKTLLTEWQIDVLFAWRSRANCDRCFNQRKYEWVGLLEHHPELFWDAESMEHNGSEYFWCGKDYPLTKIVEREKAIRKKRIRAIIKVIYALQNIQTTLFNENQEDDNTFVDIFTTSTCGLFCGK